MSGEVKKNSGSLPRFSPNTDIIEKEDGFHIYMDMPGVQKEDLVIDLKENDLAISARAVYPRMEKVSNVHLEFGDCEYSRSFTISDVVDRENIKATLKNGVLEMFLPKAAKAKPRKIEIEVAQD
ncbi:Hsp20/alpha crystallin family protein [Desulfonatronovibrio magnus]|uniref:Hsp20/alpha crystallin family protein n=1 Tax=Desulfonatronovibrio magnus TaxID=698827 RepID=UPI0005EBB5D5|nr:Hsp20/alpha crystallin family protein [Desulfonatronovibrio magnus]RQD63904.1 MAG: Hsp20/alpha crystallin family protein [Desulfonatronovibrio sp. MSAO_Bac4]